MSYSETAPLSRVKARLSEFIRRVREEHESFGITHRGRVEGVLLSVEEYESLIETLEILSDAKLMAGIRRGLRDVKAGRVHPYREVLPEK
ncbi:MAG: type II toxin-antitoxin system Phd/YefM family antitoxin [Candidatus Aminicenantales bacterium]